MPAEAPFPRAATTGLVTPYYKCIGRTIGLSLVLGAACAGSQSTEWAMLIQRDDREGVRGMLHEGADPNTADSFGRTPLHWASFYGRAAIAQDLFSQGAAIDAEGPLGTPLHEAAWMARVTTIEILLASGADPNDTNQEAKRPVELAHHGMAGHPDKERDYTRAIHILAARGESRESIGLDWAGGVWLVG
jgi:hypothetical protein